MKVKCYFQVTVGQSCLLAYLLSLSSYQAAPSVTSAWVRKCHRNSFISA